MPVIDGRACRQTPAGIVSVHITRNSYRSPSALQVFAMTVRYLVFPLALLLASVPSISLAEAQHRFSGFATLGLALNNSPSLVFRRDVTQDDGATKNSGSWKTD